MWEKNDVWGVESLHYEFTRWGLNFLKIIDTREDNDSSNDLTFPSFPANLFIQMILATEDVEKQAESVVHLRINRPLYDQTTLNQEFSYKKPKISRAFLNNIF